MLQKVMHLSITSSAGTSMVDVRSVTGSAGLDLELQRTSRGSVTWKEVQTATTTRNPYFSETCPLAGGIKI